MLGVHINRLAAPGYTKMKPPRTREPLEIWSNPGERRDQPLIFHPINTTARKSRTTEGLPRWAIFKKGYEMFAPHR